MTADEEEIHYLIDAVNRYFKEQLTREDIETSFSGVRPLFDDGQGNPSAVTRDYVFDLDESAGAPLLNIFGGKITTFRELAERGMHRIARFFPGNARRLDSGFSPARRRHGERRLRGIPQHAEIHLSLDAAQPAPALRAALRHPRANGSSARRPRSMGWGGISGGTSTRPKSPTW